MSKRTLRYSLVAMIAFLIGFGMVRSPSVHAATNERVLLVYDSQNTTAKANQKIATLQRALTSLNLRVKTIKESDYQSGELTGYDGVITMINWPKAELTNHQFVRDRQKFKGIKLHIGDNLTSAEATELGVKQHRIYQQQLILKNQGTSQLLPFSETMTVVDHLPKKAKTIGKLSTQQANQKTTSYGLIVGKNGYLPYFSTKGLSLLAAVQTLAELFGRTATYQPLLTISNVTPYSHLKNLDRLSRYCERMGIPFAISTVSVSQNTELHAFKVFAAYLRRVEDRGGIVFIQTPIVGGATAANAQELNDMFTSYLVSLARYQVYPVGISAPGYWNQDRVLRQNSLKKADHWLLLPNTSDQTYLKQDDNAQTAKMSLLAVSASSLNDVRQTETTVKFNSPTAVTVKLPDTATQVHNTERQIQQLNYSWLDPAASWQTEFISGSTDVGYQRGNYLLNGQRETVTADHVTTATSNGGTPNQQVLFKGFFKLQGVLIAGFFTIVLIVMLIFIYLGRRIYRNMFRR